MIPKQVTLSRILSSAFAILIIFTLYSCTADEEILPAISQIIPVKNISSDSQIVFKGVFATKNSKFRGIFKLILPGGTKDLEVFNANAVGSISLQNGETYSATAVKLTEKSADFRMLFESKDLSFKFTLDEFDAPQITNVVFQDQNSAIVAAQDSAENPVTPMTGTYKCTNCQDQNTTVSGIDLNNEERTFNMLLTTADGNNNIIIQALVGILVNKNLVVNESCTSTNDFTYCIIKSGKNLTTEPISWTGIQCYSEAGSAGPECSGISGNFDYISESLGTIQGEFKSDNQCANTTYFVSASGNDSNTGLSPQDAFKTIEKINSLNLEPGDAVLFDGGNEFYGNLYLDDQDANNPLNTVKISSYGTGKATIKAGNSFGIFAYNTAGITIDNLIVAGSGMNTNSNSGILFYNDKLDNEKLDGIKITNTEVFGFKKSGIEIGAWNDISGNNNNSGYKNVLIENNKVHDILDRGISSYGNFSASKIGYAHSNIVVRNCEVYNIKGYSKDGHSGNGIILSDVQNSLIEYCTAYNSGSGNTNKSGGPVGIWYWDADQVTIQYNEVYGMQSASNKDGGGFDLDGGVTNGIMQYNYSHDNVGAGYLIGQFTGARPMSNITIRYNISENDAASNGGSVYLFNGASSGSMKNIYVYNNTLYSANSPLIKYLNWKPITENINFYNNILFATNGVDLVDVPQNYAGNFAGNLYYTSGSFKIKYNGTLYSSLESFRAIGKEIYNNLPVGYEGKPLLHNPGQGGTIGFGKELSDLSAYKLQSTSPAIDAGVDLSLDKGTRDFYGSNLNQSDITDIGANEGLNASSKVQSEITSK